MFFSICTAQRNELLSYRLSYVLPVGGGDKSMRSLHPPPLESIFFVIWRIFLLFFLHVGAFSYVFLFMHITIRVGVTDYVVPPPPPPRRKNVPKRPSHGIKIAKKSPIYREGRGVGVGRGRRGRRVGAT